MDSSTTPSSTLLRGEREGRRWLPAVALLGFVSVALLGVATLSAESSAHELLSSKQQLAGVADFGVDHDLAKLAKNGEKCWMCPCCAGCEGTGAARAAGCGLPRSKEAHTKSEKQAIAASKKQAKLAADQNERDVAVPKAKAVPKASPKAKAIPNKTAAAKAPAAKKPAALPEDAHKSGVHKKRLHMKHLQMKVEKVVADDPRPISDNNNRLKDDMDMFEDASYLSPHKYDIPHLTKNISGYLHEDVIAPWVMGADRFKERSQFNADGTIKTFKHYEDPAGLFVQNPSDEEPWDFSEGQHWDSLAPEAKGFTHGEDWTTAGDKKFLTGEMKNGDNKKWSDVDDPQWGFTNQFADWDPDGDKNMRLVWGDGGLARSGGEMPNDSRLDDTNNIYEESTMKKGNKPWELTFMDPRLEGDDFVGKDNYLKSMHPEFVNPVDNQFADLDEEGKENENLVFGDNEGVSPKGQALVDEGKDDPAGLRQRMDVPINDNWNFLSDSKVNSNTVKDLLVDRSASVMPITGEPISDALTGGWQGTNGVAHSDNTPGFAEINDYPDNKGAERPHHPMTAAIGGVGGAGAEPWGRR